EAVPPNDQVDPRTELHSAIDYALVLLRDDNHQEYIKKLAFPADLAKAIKALEFDDIVASFAKDKAKVTIAVLEQIKSLEPKMNEAGTVAEFPVNVKYFFGRDKIVFEKSDDLWYIRN
ncbi:MAG TPA: hypothetical protein VMX74_01900, partial [Pirellulales bacterium]|nr:hypothetical protein [Pirellulales bacterium]